MNRPPCNRKPSPKLDRRGRRVHASAPATVVWRRTIGPSESSPLVAGGSVFVGDWNGHVWALRRRDRQDALGDEARRPGEGRVAISGNRIFVGDYSGHLYALNAHNGQAALEGEGAAAVRRHGHASMRRRRAAYGRVYVGATDGKVYSFGAASGKLRWSQSTGGYVYSSTAVWREPVYVGSYSKRFFCFDAATGDVLWQFRANGPISGSPTMSRAASTSRR